MYILFIIISIIGLSITYLGIKWTLKHYNSKEIIEFSFVEKEIEFEIKKIGLYSLCILGGGYVKNSGRFKIHLINQNDHTPVDLKENLIKFRFRKKWKMGVEYLYFRATSTGKYKLEINNHEDLIVKKSMLPIKQVLQSKTSINQLKILIKENIGTIKIFFGIIFLILGVHIFLWGMILAIKPDLF